MASASIKKRSIVIGTHKTSFSLEQPFIDALKRIAEKRRISLQVLVAEIDANRGNEGNLSSSLRLYVLQRLQKEAA